jgi:tetratricopeptide (TPR) repeat protein
MRARLLAQSGQPEAAITDLQTLTAQQPDNFEARITLASLYASVDRWASLEDLIPRIAERPGLQDVALYLEGRAALAQDRAGTARAKFEAALEALPEGADQLRSSLHFYRGLCLQRLERDAEAQRSILRAIDGGFRPETSEEAILASRSLLQAERPGDAIPLLEAITLNRITPEAEVWAMLGRAHLASGTPTLALSAFNEALQMDPEVAGARALRGSLLRNIGDLEGALADYESAQRQSPENAAIAYARSLVHLQLGQLEAAHAAISLAAQASPGESNFQLLRALLAYTLNAGEPARSALALYFEQNPQPVSPTAHYLDFLLNGAELEVDQADPVRQYFLGSSTLKAALDAAGRAETPEQARKQICSTAFWMAQFERQRGDSEQAEKLLAIALDTGNPDLFEYQFARWQSGP